MPEHCENCEPFLEKIREAEALSEYDPKRYHAIREAHRAYLEHRKVDHVWYCATAVEKASVTR